MKKDIINTFSTRILSIILSIGNSIFLTRLLGVEGKGEMAIFIASLAFFSMFLSFSMQPAIVYYGARNELNYTKLFNTIIIYSITIGFLFFLGVNNFYEISDNSLFLHKNKNGLFYQIALSIVVTLTLVMNQLKGVFSAMKKFNYLNFFQIFSIVTGLLFYSCLFIGQEKFDVNFRTVFNTYLSVIILNFIVTLFYFFKHFPFNPFRGLLDLKSIKLLLSFAGIAYIGTIAQFLNYRIDLWFVDYFLGVKELGLYSLAANLSQMLWILPQSIAFVLMPHISSGQINLLDKTLSIGRLIILISLIVTFFSFFFVPVLVPILYGVEFSESGSIFLILLLGVIPYCLSTLYASYFSGTKRLSINTNSAFIGLVATIILDFILIPKHGAIGAAYASSFSYLVSTLYLVFKMSSISDKNILNLLAINSNDISLIKNLFISIAGKK